MKFLLVDDNDLGGQAVAFALEAYGHQVTIERSGCRVVEQLLAGRYDVIILDVSLGDGDGISVASAIRERWHSIPIIFTTGHETYPGLAAALLDSKTRMLRKPYDISALLSLAHELLRAREDWQRTAAEQRLH